MSEKYLIVIRTQRRTIKRTWAFIPRVKMYLEFQLPDGRAGNLVETVVVRVRRVHYVECGNRFVVEAKEL